MAPAPIKDDAANGPAQRVPSALGQRMFLLLLLGVFLTLTMPRFIYVGDPVSIRATTISWLTRGRIDVPEDVARRFGERGQYFFEHPENGNWYSKYGVANTFLFVPPLAGELLWNGELPYYAELSPEGRRTRCLLLNVWNIVVTLVLAGYLHALAIRYGGRPGTATLFVLLAVLGTFLWYYARAQTVEIFQVTLFVLAFHHLGRFHATARAGSGRGAALHAGAAIGLLGLLCLAKLVFLPLLPIFTGFVVFQVVAEGNRPGAGICESPWLARWNRGSVLFVVASVAIAVCGLILWSNDYRFGAPLKNGYQQFEREQHLFRISGAGLWGYLADPRKSILLYFPLLPLALLGIRRIPGPQRSAYACAWLGFSVLYGVNASFVNWRGDWCYGPRYLLFALPVLALPAASLLSADWPLRPAKGLLTAGLLLLALMTINAPLAIHGMEYFAAFRAERSFESFEDPVVRDYFSAPHWVVNRDLQRFRRGRTPFPPLEQVRSRLSDASYERAVVSLQSVPVGNFYWLAALPSRPPTTESARR